MLLDRATETTHDTLTTFVNGRARVVPDLTHHLSDLAKARRPSPLKVLIKYIGQKDVLSLAGGTPHPDYFPFHTLSAEVLTPEAYEANPVAEKASESPLEWLWRFFGSAGDNKPKTENITIPKYDPSGDQTAVQLSQTLQYSSARGIPALNEFITEFTQKVYQPYLPTTTNLVHTGNTDGWHRAITSLCNPGEGVLTEEWTYPSAVATAWPYGIKAITVAMDGEGMRADALEDVLANWNAEERGGMKRPHVVYLIPIGQNPSGGTMGIDRKKAIYEVCVKYDVIIVEDDPYFFLQEGPYVPAAYRLRASPSLFKTEEEEAKAWIETLSPSFVKIDYESRVIRLDSFSKTIAPGSRLGFFTCNPVFAEKLERVGEVSTQAPCGFGQTMITKLLADKWGFNNYIRWLRGLQRQYTERRDRMIDHIASEFHLSEEESDPSFLSGARVLVARERHYGNERERKSSSFYEKNKSWFSFIPPTSGMFVWVKVHLYNHPQYEKQSLTPGEPDQTLEQGLWLDLLKNNVLLGPGWIFEPDSLQEDNVVDALLKQGRPAGGDLADHGPSYAHFRIAFSAATDETMQKSMAIFAMVLKKFFDDN